MILVDTSVWIDFFRGRTPSLVGDLGRLLDADEVLLPAPVRIELLAGANRRDATRLARLFAALPLVVPTEATWRQAEHWALEAGRSGDDFGVADLLLAALCAEHGAALWTLDGDFRRMAARGWIAVHAVA